MVYENQMGNRLQHVLIGVEHSLDLHYKYHLQFFYTYLQYSIAAFHICI